MDNIKKDKKKPKKANIKDINKVGILGSGLMGHGIAYVTALVGIKTVMVDRTQKTADVGLSKIELILLGKLKKGLLTKEKMKKILNKITATNDFSKLAGCDLIIEAVYEDRDLKGRVTIQAEKYINKESIFASNTSTIPITTLAKKSRKPDNFIGIHFFSPVHRMKLIEIIKGKKTSQMALLKALDYAKKIKKTPIVVNDSPGFYTTRVFERYTNEGLEMIYEGQKIESIENSAINAGYPVGPLAIIDEININLIANIRKQKYQENKEKIHKMTKFNSDKVIDLMIKKVNRTGRSGIGGFYEYPKHGRKFLWTDIKKYFPLSKKQLSKREMIDRFYFSQAIEAIRCYEEGVIESVSDANIGSILGWGFPKAKGGTLKFVNDYGISKFIDQAEKLADKYGDRFAPPKLLQQLAKSGKTF
tara:strand:- start:922 stop:2175 length:1254 start_codon:yes stop_codon:yes gene_type:complete